MPLRYRELGEGEAPTPSPVGKEKAGGVLSNPILVLIHACEFSSCLRASTISLSLLTECM